jgi:hypothetical protein
LAALALTVVISATPLSAHLPLALPLELVLSEPLLLARKLAALFSLELVLSKPWNNLGDNNPKNSVW